MKQNYKIKQNEQGFSLIELMIVIAIIGILIGVAVPAWRNSIRATNQANAIRTLNTLATVQVTYYNSHNRSKYGTFPELVQDGALDNRFANEPPTVDGYTFTMKVTPKTAGQQPGYTVNADPQSSEGIGATGKLHFYMGSDSSTVHVNETQPASVTDPAAGG